MENYKDLKERIVSLEKSLLPRVHLVRERYQRARSDVVSQRSVFFELLDDIYFSLSTLAEDLKPNISAKNLDVLHFLLSRSMKNFRSIRLLLTEGNDQDGKIILRALMENYITLKYIAVDKSGGRAKRFREFQWVEITKHIEKWKRFDKSFSPEFSEMDLAEVEKRSDSWKNEFCKNPKNWHGFSALRELAAQKDVNLERQFLEAYSTFSLFTHPAMLSAKSYLGVGRFANTLSWSPSGQDVKVVGVLAMGYILESFSIYAQSLDCNSFLLSEYIDTVKFFILQVAGSDRELF